MTRTSVRAAIAAAGTAFVLAGCASTPPVTPSPTETPTVAEPTTAPPVTETPSASPTTEAPSEPAPSRGVDLSEHNASALVAIGTAEADTGGIAFSLDWTRSRWEIELIAGDRIHELYLSADGTSITEREAERAEAEDLRLLDRAEVPMADAIVAAVAGTPDAVLVEADLDTRRGEVVWEVDTGTGADRQRIYVDAVTGAVI